MANNSKWTPGPWETVLIGSEKFPQSSDYILIKGDSGRDYIGRIDADRETARVAGHPWKNEANARLIKAAPDMLEALELAIATIERLKPPTLYDSTQGTRDVIKSVIARAKDLKEDTQRLFVRGSEDKIKEDT